MNKLFIAFVAFIATFFVHGFQFFKKQTPLVNAIVVGLVVYFVAGFLGFKEGAGCTKNSTCTSSNMCNLDNGKCLCVTKGKFGTNYSDWCGHTASSPDCNATTGKCTACGTGYTLSGSFCQQD